MGFKIFHFRRGCFSGKRAPLTGLAVSAPRLRQRGIFKGAFAGIARGALGLSGAKNPTSNAQGVDRQRAPRAAEFVSKNPKPQSGFVTY